MDLLLEAVVEVVKFRGGSRILGKGGSDKYIHNWGRSRDSKGV